MRKVRTHTFKRGKYRIEKTDELIRGICEIPDESDDLYMIIPSGDDLMALQTTLHESLHANGLPDKYLDGDYDVSEEPGRLLWREGWRKMK